MKIFKPKNRVARVIDELLMEHERLANNPFCLFPPWDEWVDFTCFFMADDIGRRYGSRRAARQLKRMRFTISGAEEGVVRFSWKGRPVGPLTEAGEF